MNMVLIRNFLTKLAVFLEMIKFEHSIFALPFAYLGLFLAEKGWPRLPIFLWVTVAMVSFRTMAMGLNRLIDQAIDAKNPRTKNRALPAGKIQSSFVWVVTIASWVVFEWSAFQLSPLCLKLSWIPVFLAYLYPWMKRFTWLSHFVLGIILGIAPYGAWLASRGQFSWIPALLTLGIMCWVGGFDIIYSLQDKSFDRQNRLYSFPVRFGTQSSLAAVRCLHALAVISWFAAGWFSGLGWIYLSGLFVVVLFLIRENWLVKSCGMARIQEAFFHMNAVVSVVLFLAVVFDFSFGKVSL